jgi:hypothetical protein
MGGDSKIIKIVLGFRPTFIAAVVDRTELAMLSPSKLRRSLVKKEKVIMTNRGNELIHFAKINLLKA